MKNHDVVYKTQTKRWKNLKLLKKDVKVTTNDLNRLKIVLDNGQAEMENLQTDSEMFDKYFYEDLRN